MLTNGIPGECTAVTEPNIHEILLKIDAVLSDTNERADRINNFLRSQPTVPAKEEPGIIDMFSHVMNISDKAMALFDKINEITQILGI